METLKDTIYNYKTKYPQGFTEEEIQEVLKTLPPINIDKYNNAMMGNTCMRIEGEIINYHIDVYKAILCGLENRDLHLHEWD